MILGPFGLGVGEMIILLFFYFLLAFAAGSIASNKTIGFWGGFLLSLLFTPVVGFIFALAASAKQAHQPVINNNNYYNPNGYGNQYAGEPAGQNQTVQPDKFQVLEKLAALRAQGVLSEEEFQREKSKVLNS